MSNTVINFNKSLHPDDYNDPDIEMYGDIFDSLRTSVPSSIQHKHRRWEHCMAMAAIDHYIDIIGQRFPRCILEVGSGGSLFAAMCSYKEYCIDVIDPDITAIRLADKQGTIGTRHNDYMDEIFPYKYDAVVCLSVLEHIKDDLSFFKKLLRDTRYLLFLTVDFSSDGRVFSKDHLRTYSPTALYNLYLLAHEQGFLMPSNPEWFISNGNHVYDYNFASLCLVRNEKIQPKSL